MEEEDDEEEEEEEEIETAGEAFDAVEGEPAGEALEEKVDEDDDEEWAEALAAFQAEAAGEDLEEEPGIEPEPDIEAEPSSGTGRRPHPLPPPPGPVGGPQCFYRGQRYRPGSGKWMNRGGRFRDFYKQKYGRSGGRGADREGWWWRTPAGQRALLRMIQAFHVGIGKALCIGD